MFLYLQQKYELTDYQMAQFKFFLKTMLSEISKLLIIAFFFKDDLSCYFFTVFMMILMRSATGGMHCKHYLTCLLFSFCYIMVILKILVPFEPIVLARIPVLMACAFVMYLIGPVSSPIHLKLNDDALKKSKIRGVLIVAIISILTYSFPKSHFMLIAFWEIAVHTIQLIIAYAERRWNA